MFRQIATPDPKARTFSLRRTLRDGRCRVATNGRGCGQASKTRGLCPHHYSVLGNRPELLARIALPAREVAARVYTPAATNAQGVDRCVVLENGVHCTLPPDRRGVCREHRKRIGNSREYSLSDFYLAEPTTTLERKPDEEILDGLCEVIEDAAGCERTPHVRGLCRRHYRAAKSLERLDELASPQRGRNSRYGAGNDRPHFYLDKNVLFDHANHKVFKEVDRPASVRLLKQIIGGRVRASVSADAIKSTYNHIRYRLELPVDERGKALSSWEADRIARRHIAETFYAGGAWRVIVLDPQTFARVATRAAGELSLEDALEFQAYQQARSGKAGPTIFVTRDTDFLEGVHPDDVTRHYRW